MQEQNNKQQEPINYQYHIIHIYYCLSEVTFVSVDAFFSMTPPVNRSLRHPLFAANIPRTAVYTDTP